MHKEENMGRENFVSFCHAVIMKLGGLQFQHKELFLHTMLNSLVGLTTIAISLDGTIHIEEQVCQWSLIMMAKWKVCSEVP